MPEAEGSDRAVQLGWVWCPELRNPARYRNKKREGGRGGWMRKKSFKRLSRTESRPAGMLWKAASL